MIDYKALKEKALIDKEIITAKDGLFTIKIEGQYVHSFYSPSKEATRLVENILNLDREETLIIILGSGFGYHIEILEKNGFKNILIIEKNPKIFNIFQKIYRISQTHFIISPEDSAEKLDNIFSLIEIQNFRNIKTVVLRGGYKKEFYAPFEERIERILKVKLGDFSTRLNFEEIWFINILKNIPNLKNSYPVHQLFFKKLKIPVLIVSAGPSLKSSLNMINDIKDYCVTIAADTALLPLFEAGIIPDFVYSLDSQVHNLSDFSQIDRTYLSKIGLVYDIVVNPALPEFFTNCRQKISENNLTGNFITNTAHLDFDYGGNPFLIKNEFVNWIEMTGGIKIGDIESGGSVSTSAFHFAYSIGGNPILLTGQDLAYSYKTTHSTSTSHFYRMLQKNNRLNPIQSTFLKILLSRKLIQVNGFNINNKSMEDITTDFVLNNFRGWFEESAKNIIRLNPDIPLINTTETGAVIKNFTNEGLGEWVKKLKKNGQKIDRKKLFDNQLIDSNKIDKIMTSILQLGNFIKQLKSDKSIFEAIDTSEWTFLGRYFMKDRVIFERYDKFDKAQLDKKIYRLLKNIEGITNGERKNIG